MANRSSSEPPGISAGVVLFVLVTALCGLALGLAALLRLLFPPAALLLLALALPLVILISVSFGGPNYAKGRLGAFDMSQFEELAVIAAGLLCSPFLFGALCREIFLLRLLAFQNAGSAGYSAWIGFGFDNLFEAVLLDIPALYSLHSSPIRAVSFWSASLVLLYRLAVDLVLLKLLIQQARHRKRI